MLAREIAASMSRAASAGADAEVQPHHSRHNGRVKFEDQKEKERHVQMARSGQMIACANAFEPSDARTGVSADAPLEDVLVADTPFVRVDSGGRPSVVDDEGLAVHWPWEGTGPRGSREAPVQQTGQKRRRPADDLILQALDAASADGRGEVTQTG